MHNDSVDSSVETVSWTRSLYIRLSPTRVNASIVNSMGTTRQGHAMMLELRESNATRKKKY